LHISKVKQGKGDIQLVLQLNTVTVHPIG